MDERLGIRTAYSLGWGTISLSDLFENLAQMGCKTVAITDRDTINGYPACREYAQEKGIHLIAGAQLLCKAGSVFAFVENRRGFSRLCELLSRRNQDPRFDYLPSLAHDSLGLILASCEPAILSALAESKSNVYAAITPRSLRSLSVRKSLGLPLVALDDATFLDEGEREVHAVLRAMATKKTVGFLQEGEMEGKGGVLLSPHAFDQTFEGWPQALEGTHEIAQRCSSDGFGEQLVFPDYSLENSSCDEELRRRVFSGAERRYGEVSDAILQRIEYELDIIGKKGFSSYFLVMHDIVCMSSRSCGRGSGAASIVSYCLQITNVDPIAYNLYFERFLSMARTDPPDIDVDFAWDERDGIFHSVIERFGIDHCARVANHNTFRLRSALRETSRSYGLSDAQITEMERQLFAAGLKGVTDPLWLTICSIAKKLEGLPKELSMHCGGLVITPKPVTSYAPVYVSREKYPLLGWEKEGTEAAGFVKIDLLGNRSLAVIRDALSNLREMGLFIDEYTWKPAEDEETIEALARGDSMGVFYIESPAMRQLQKKTGKGDFDHIVIHSSIIRPAANKYITEYVERLKGKKWEALHPRLAYILDETYGILCYQEDVSKTAVALAGFSEADADALRKVIAKKAGGVKLKRYEERFFSGCLANGVDRQTIQQIWDMMLSFDGYSFCKPHSASYAMVSFQSAYLRIHHGATFMAAVLTNQGGYYRPHAYISEARRMGIQIAGPDVNRSRIGYHAEGNTMVIGLMAIQKLRYDAMAAIQRERKQNGPYVNLEDFAKRLDLASSDFVSLVASGSCDGLAPAMKRKDQLRTLLVSRRSSGAYEQGDLFAVAKPVRAIVERLPQTRHSVTEDELHREYEALGFLRSYHPLVLFSSLILPLQRIKACDLNRYEGKYVTLVGWQVTQKEVLTKDGQSMCFVSFEDETALYEAVLFPELLSRFYKMLCLQWPLQVFGLVQNDQGALCLQIQNLRQIGK